MLLRAFGKKCWRERLSLRVTSAIVEGDWIKENFVDMTRSMHGGNEKFILDFIWNIWRENTWKTQAYVGG
jgi:hypothetical protein